MDEDMQTRLLSSCQKAERAEIGFSALPIRRVLIHGPNCRVVFIPMTEEEKAAYGGDVHTWVIKILLVGTEG